MSILFVIYSELGLYIETVLEGKREILDMMIEGWVIEGLRRIFQTSKDEETLV